MQSFTIDKDNFDTTYLEDEYYKFCDFVGISPEGGHVTSDFADCRFENIDWYWGLFNVVNFVGCKFTNCTFRGTAFSDCKFVECEFVGCDFTKDNLNADCRFDGSVAYQCRFLNTDGFRAELKLGA